MNASVSCANSKERKYDAEISQYHHGGHHHHDDFTELGHTGLLRLVRGFDGLVALDVCAYGKVPWQLVNKKNS